MGLGGGPLILPFHRPFLPGGSLSRQTDWLTDWLTDRLTAADCSWLTDWLLWLTDWQTDWHYRLRGQCGLVGEFSTTRTGGRGSGISQLSSGCALIPAGAAVLEGPFVISFYCEEGTNINLTQILIFSAFLCWGISWATDAFHALLPFPSTRASACSSVVLSSVITAHHECEICIYPFPQAVSLGAV